MRFALYVSLLLALVGCSCPSTKKQESFRINIRSEPFSLDPRKARDLSSQMVVRALFEGLTRIGLDEKPHLALAEHMEISADKKRYLFSLKKSFWSNGDPVRAQDFVYSVKSALAPSFSSSSAYQLFVIKNARLAQAGKTSMDDVGIYAVDESHLCIELQDPVPYFLELLSFPIFFPINAENLDVSNGPFRLKEWAHADHITLQRSDSYWDVSSVKLAEVELVMLAEDTELKCFEKKELDWAGSPLSVLPLDAFQHLKGQKVLHQKPFLSTYFFRCNTEHAFLKSSLVRKALSLSLDRRALVEHVLQGSGAPAISLVHPHLSLVSSPLLLRSRREDAKRLFAEGLHELHLEGAALRPLVLSYGAGDRNRLIAEAVQEEFRRTLGIEMKLEAVESKVFFTKLAKLDYQMAISSWIADFHDPLSFLEVFKSKTASTNNTGWEDAEYQKALDASCRTIDLTQRRGYLARCEEILQDQMPIIPLFHASMNYLCRDQVHNLLVTDLGAMDIKWIHLEE